MSPGQESKPDLRSLSSPSFASFPPQVLLPRPGFAIRMRTGMLQHEAKATDTVYLIQLKKGY